MLVLTLAAPARAERLEGGWTHDLDLPAGSGAGVVAVTVRPWARPEGSR